MEFMDRYDEAIEELRKQPDTPLNRLPGFIQDFLQMEDKTDEAQIRVLKEFFERFKIEEVQNRNIIVEGIIEDGYVFTPMEKEYDEDVEMDPETLKSIENMLFEKGNEEQSTEKDRLVAETVRTMLLARPYFTARDAFTVGFLLESMCYHYKELIPVDKEKGIYMRKFKKPGVKSE